MCKLANILMGKYLTWSTEETAVSQFFLNVPKNQSFDSPTIASCKEQVVVQRIQFCFFNQALRFRHSLWHSLSNPMVHVVDINDINVCLVTAGNFGVLVVAWKLIKNTCESEDVVLISEN